MSPEMHYAIADASNIVSMAQRALATLNAMAAAGPGAKPPAALADQLRALADASA